MGFWIYFVFPLLVSLILLILARWQKTAKVKKWLKALAMLLLILALIFGGYVVFYGVSNKIAETNRICISMLLVLISYLVLAIFIRPSN